ncbi:class I SAM-dependent methyltransferase [Hydrogenovibrio kuenenii]|uniref:class I SAM-dependent methyltransferase n=1 Tax=Hydrogenovibrio kuenenii TaxID=63658 RepID=UPI000466C29E|nr:class I SAM-dependent methyltransferase [Hydrogenovibrio kuenenii]
MSPKMFSRLMRIIKYLVSEKTLAHQARKPTGFLGKYVLQPMFVHGNAALNAFMLEKLDVKSTDCILEIGFGPGVMLADLSERIEEGKVHGIDFSKTMIEQATIRNQPHIESGCLELCEGCSDLMSYEDNHFDKVVTGNTLYFWHPPEPHLQEILRVLKPGGLFVMGFRDKAQIDQMQLNQEVFLRYTQQDVVALLESTGFAEVSVEIKGSMPVDSYVAIATKLD